MLSTKVKVSSVTNLTDARYFSAWEVEWLGFALDPASEHYVQPQVVKAIREWVDGPGIVGEFGLQSADEIRTAIELLDLDAVQAGVFTDAGTLAELQSPVPVIKEIVVEPGTREDDLAEQLDRFAHLAGYFLLNFDKNGIAWEQLKSDRPFSLSFLQEICRQHSVFLSLDLSPATLGEVLQTLRPYGLNLTGGEEEKIGFKSFEEIDTLLEALSEEEG